MEKGENRITNIILRGIKDYRLEIDSFVHEMVRNHLQYLLQKLLILWIQQ